MFPWHHSSGSWPPSSSSPPTASTWPPTAPPTSSTMHPALSWTTPPPTPTPPTAHHHPGHQLDQPHYQAAPTTYPTLTPGSTDHFFGQPSALQSSWPTMTPISTTASSPTPPTFPTTTSPPQVSSISHQILPTLPPTGLEAPTFPTPVPNFAAHAGPSFSAPCQTIPSPETTAHCPVPHSQATSSPATLPSHTTQTTPPQAPAPTQAAPKHTAVKAAPKVRTEKRSEKPRRPAHPPAVPPSPAEHPLGRTATQQELATLGTTTKELAESGRFIQQQQQIIIESQRLQQQQLHQVPPTTTSPISPPTTSVPAAKARPTEPQAPASTPTTGKTAPPIRIPSKSPTHRPRRSRSRRCSPHSPQGRSQHRRQTRPRSPLPRQRSTTQNPKSRRTPSPYRRRSPARRPDPPRRHRTPDPPRLSRTPSRNAIVLTPASRSLDPSFIPTPDADETWGKWGDKQPHRVLLQPHLHLCPVNYRIANGDSDDSDQEEHFSIGNYEPGDIDVEGMKTAADDPERVPCVAELDPTHSIQLRTTLDPPTRLLCNNFIDEMFTQLAKPYVTESNETVYIKASRATVTNIAKCFAQARLLDISLAKRTRGYFVEPECLLTITVPTGLPPKDTFKGEFAGAYVSYHKTSWESVAKILAENCVRPASWTKNEAGIPMQYPCYGFFGYSSEIVDPDDLKLWPIRVCTSNLYKIGKGQNPSGILATCRTPKLIRAQSGGNDQIQRLCALQGIAKGKDGATAMNSKCASVSYVASTHQVDHQGSNFQPWLYTFNCRRPS